MTDRASIVVFAGPSLHQETASEILGPSGIVLPPAAAGDLIRALRLRPRAIVLIDGRFDDVPSPWHKELLLALEHGVYVFGGASMGALRAIECERFGATAIGRIADSYRAGRREDDAVAIRHLPAAGGWRPVSTALVDIEAVLESQTTAGVISEARARELIRDSRETLFPQRALPADVAGHESGPGLKQRDAALTCQKAVETKGRRQPGMRVPRTTWLLRLARIALGSPFPECPALPNIERQFRATIDAEPWLAPLLSDAITFATVKIPTDRPTLTNARRETLLEHHLSRVLRSSPQKDLGEALARCITSIQAAILESCGDVSLGDGLRGLLEPDAGTGALDDALARAIRSEGIPPVQDLLLDSEIEKLLGTIDLPFGG